MKKSLQEIEDAARDLPVEEQQELVLRLAERLRLSSRTLPAPRDFSKEEMDEWLREDERAGRDLRGKE